MTNVTPNLAGLKVVANLQADLQWINAYGNQFFNYTGTTTDEQYIKLLSYMTQVTSALTTDVQALIEQMPVSKIKE